MENHERDLNLSRLQKRYHVVLSQAVYSQHEEEVRKQHMEHMLLHVEIDELREMLDRSQEELNTIAAEESELQLELRETYANLQESKNTLKTLAAEKESLHNEIALLNAHAAEANKTLGEKMRLSKELLNAQSEIQRLKSQNSSHQTILMEKQNLERLLNSLELELQDQKRTNERIRMQEHPHSTNITNMSLQLEETRKKLAEEVRSRKIDEQNFQNQAVEWSAQRAALEGQIETLNMKLRIAEKEAHKSTQNLHGKNKSPQAEGAYINEGYTKTVPLKRPGVQVNHGMSIATPGAICPREVTKITTALPGDKSVFSITPFLNRTGCTPDYSQSSESDADEINTITIDEAEQPSSRVGGGQAKNESLGPRPKFYLSPGEGYMLQKGEKKSSVSARMRTVAAVGKGNCTKTANSPFDGDSFVPHRSEDLTPTNRQKKSKRRKLGARPERMPVLGGESDDDLGETGKPSHKFSNGKRLASDFSLVVGNQILQNQVAGGFSPLKREKKRV
ncbi:hypothetical protein ASPZODRAFT_136553 [Penicilliopsis zonata CBS 506.65]|uniref:Uncharacterized protein n=1 Tax=Penicilliopsis zonata CBS 506.65 TaxID=1073090 RepID=A0A1L9S829_9EURO|nr:hypothetical protein ASPZODRAFT_136553 [Penicilliopsis zonata CBS 506.65]OJJ43324.1 hypothetical protein ASPZODRAFT_136553 [Penicilliopsis zonata CBS 506.65]